MIRSRVEKACRPAAAFTIVELLVVIAILGMLAALLMPAVQAARESARRTQCSNNLKEIALAFQQHHEKLGFFPTGGWNWNDTPTYLSGVPATGERQKAGWCFQILPYLGAENVWTAGPQVAIGTAIPTFFCPSRREPQTLVIDHDPYEPPVTGASVTHALCDYAASNRELTGIVRRYKPVRLQSVTDGTTFTLLAADKRLNLANLGRAQRDDNEGYTVGWNSDTIRRTNRPPEPDYSGEGDGEKRFGSSHPNGINAALADGSVRYVVYEIKPPIFRALGSIGDGEIFDHDDL